MSEGIPRSGIHPSSHGQTSGEWPGVGLFPQLPRDENHLCGRGSMRSASKMGLLSLVPLLLALWTEINHLTSPNLRILICRMRIFTKTSERLSIIVTSVIQMWKLRLRELGSFVQGYTNNEHRTKTLTQVTLTPESRALNHYSRKYGSPGSW